MMWWFLILILINTAIAAGYLIWGLLRCSNPRYADADLSKESYWIRAIVMLLCPLVGPLFFLIGRLFYYLLFHQDVDLEDVIFSKERVQSHMHADEERERNMVPLEEAIAISDKESLRTLMLNVIKGDIQNSLSAIALALNSPDSETSHYAASVLRDELNDFRMTVQRLYQGVHKNDENQLDYAVMLISYMNGVLEQRVFTDMEQISFVRIMEEVCRIVHEKNRKRMTGEFYEWICLRLLEIKEYTMTEEWCGYGMEQYPDLLSSYTCQLKLYFTMGEKKKFFAVMEQLKASNIIIDKETLELIRIFG